MLSRCIFLITLGFLFVSSTAYPKRRRRGGTAGSDEDNDIPLKFRGRGLTRGQDIKGKVLDRTELKDCVIRHEALDESQARLDSTSSDLETLEQSLQRDSKKIEEDRLAVDQYSRAAVDQFNLTLEEHQRAVDRSRERVDKYNLAAARNKNDADSFNAKCAERWYYLDDMRSVLRELGITDK